MDENDIAELRAAVADTVAEAFSEQLAGFPEAMRAALVERVMAARFVVDQVEATTQRFAGRLN